MVLAERLPVLRRSRGWSQECLAEQLGVSRQAVGQWETGQASPEIDNLLRLAALSQKTHRPTR